MSDLDTLTLDQDVDTLDNIENSGGDTVSMEEYNAMKKKADDQEKARIKFQAELKELKGKETVEPTAAEQGSTAATAPDASEELFDLKMEMRGFKTEKERDVIKAAIGSGLTQDEAMTNEFVLSKINSIRTEDKVAQATDISGSGAGDTPSNDDLLVRNLKKGELPTDSEGAMKLLELAKKDPEIEKLMLGR